MALDLPVLDRDDLCDGARLCFDLVALEDARGLWEEESRPEATVGDMYFPDRVGLRRFAELRVERCDTLAFPLRRASLAFSALMVSVSFFWLWKYC